MDTTEDVGKKGNPSHSSIFAIKDDPIFPVVDSAAGMERKDGNGYPIQNMIMIHQRFFDGWEYTRQIEYLNAAVEYFNVQRGYYDNTRAELEERGLPRQIIPVALESRDGPKSKSKYGLATNFSKLVEQKRIWLIDDDRFISQITCVTSDLQAAETPLGHGDSFISCCLAIGAYYDFYARDRRTGFQDLGNIQALVSERSPNDLVTAKGLPMDNCKICGRNKFQMLPNGQRKCLTCETLW